jgi:hypothetical protein
MTATLAHHIPSPPVHIFMRRQFSQPRTIFVHRLCDFQHKQATQKFDHFHTR